MKRKATWDHASVINQKNTCAVHIMDKQSDNDYVPVQVTKKNCLNPPVHVLSVSCTGRERGGERERRICRVNLGKITKSRTISTMPFLPSRVYTSHWLAQEKFVNLGQLSLVFYNVFFLNYGHKFGDPTFAPTIVGQLKGHFGTIDSENRYMYFWQNKVFAYICTFNNAERMILTYVYRNTTLHIISNFGGHSLSNIAKIKDFQSALSVAQIWAKWLRIKRALRISALFRNFTGKYALLLLAETR